MGKIALGAAFAAVALVACPAFAIPLDQGSETSPPPPAPPAADTDPLLAKIADAGTRFQNKDYAGARAELEQVAADPGFSNLSADAQFACEANLAQVDLQLSDAKAALTEAKLATASDEADASTWALRFEAAYNVKDDADATISLTQIAQRSPEALANYYDQAIYRMIDAKGVDPAQHAALLEALYAAKWKPTDPFSSTDHFLFKLTESRLAGGDQASAISAASGISDGSLLASMKIDKRFDAVVASDPSRFDLAAAFAHDVDDDRARSAANPGKLQGIAVLAQDLLNRNRAAEALKVTEDALARTQTSQQQAAFSDYSDQINWIENSHAWALFALGRFDDGIAEMARIAQRPESGQPNVSQVINLADLYNSVGRSKDAIAVFANFDPATASPYGVMQMQFALACAGAQLHDDAGMTKAIGYLKEHKDVTPDTYFDALLCTNDLDGAAQEIIAQLDDPQTRNYALYRMQDFVSPPNPSPMTAEILSRRDIVRARPDVMAAIEKYGRIISIPALRDDY